MMDPSSLDVALKEWDTVCRALATGRQIILLRKGGIYEAAGEFKLQHRAFLLFPTFLHQTLKGLKPEAHADYLPLNEEPHTVRLAAAGVVTDIIQLRSRAQMDAIDDQHIWGRPLIDMRFGYRPENPLYLMLVRAYRLAQPIALDNTPAYAGCKSWVPLEQPIATGAALAVLEDEAFEQRRRNVLEKIRLQNP